MGDRISRRPRQRSVGHGRPRKRSLRRLGKQARPGHLDQYPAQVRLRHGRGRRRHGRQERRNGPLCALRRGCDVGSPHDPVRRSSSRQARLQPHAQAGVDHPRNRRRQQQRRWRAVVRGRHGQRRCRRCRPSTPFKRTSSLPDTGSEPVTTKEAKPDATTTPSVLGVGAVSRVHFGRGPRSRNRRGRARTARRPHSPQTNACWRRRPGRSRRQAPVTPPAFVPPEEQPAAEPTGWHTEFSGYFRAPISMGISSRPGPDDPSGPAQDADLVRTESRVRLELLQLRLHASAGTGLGGALRPRKDEAHRRRDRVDGILVSIGRASGTPTRPGHREWPISPSTPTSK